MTSYIIQHIFLKNSKTKINKWKNCVKKENWKKRTKKMLVVQSVTYVKTWKACNQGLNFEEIFPKSRISLMLSNFYACDLNSSLKRKSHTSIKEFIRKKKKCFRPTQKIRVVAMTRIFCFCFVLQKALAQDYSGGKLTDTEWLLAGCTKLYPTVWSRRVLTYFTNTGSQIKLQFNER